jgi:hypothetical protein
MMTYQNELEREKNLSYLFHSTYMLPFKNQRDSDREESFKPDQADGEQQNVKKRKVEDVQTAATGVAAEGKLDTCFVVGVRKFCIVGLYS